MWYDNIFCKATVLTFLLECFIIRSSKQKTKETRGRAHTKNARSLAAKERKKQKMLKINDENLSNGKFFAIRDWMVSRLDLSGNELVLYACIYSYSNSPAGCYNGSVRYLSERINCSERWITQCLKLLTIRGLLRKSSSTVDGRTVNSYRAVIPEWLRGGIHTGEENSPIETENAQSVGEENSPGGVNKVQSAGEENSVGIGEENSPNKKLSYKKEDNKDYKKEGEESECAPVKRGPFRNIILTDGELDQLIYEYGGAAKKYIDRLSMHMASTGKEYQSHYATVVRWITEDNEKVRPTPKSDEVKSDYAGFDLDDAIARALARSEREDSWL